MKGKFFLAVCLFLIQTRGFSQIKIGASANFKSSGNIFLVVQNLDVINNGSCDFSQGTLVLKGATNVGLQGLAEWHLGSLVVEKASGQVTLGTNLSVDEKINLIKGTIDLNGKKIVLASSAILTGETEDNRITGLNGGSIQIAIPLAAPNSLNPGNLGAFITSPVNLGTTIIKRSHKPAVGSEIDKINRFYEITPSVNTNLQAVLRFSYLDNELNGLTETNLQLAQSSDFGNTWGDQGYDDKNSVSNYIEKSGINSFSYYALSDPTITVSVTWGSIQAACKGKAIQVKWTTVAEQNLQQFIVQRSASGSPWTDIGTVPATGNSSGIKAYAYNDATPPSGANINYRIVAVAGKNIFYSGAALASPCKKISAQLVPSLATSSTTLTLNSETNFKTLMTVAGLDGKLYQQRAINIQEGVNQFTIDVSGLKSGTYYVQIGLPDGDKESLVLIKQ